MIINTTKVTDLMVRYGLKSTDELLLIQCIFQRDYRSLHNLAICKGKDAAFTHDIIIGLVEKNIFQKEPLRHHKKNEDICMMDLFLTPEFIDQHFIETKLAGEQLWLAYPNATEINGQYMPLKKGDKIGNIYYDKDKLIAVYCNKIGNNLALHREILEKVEAHKKVGNINFAIRSFILDELWESLILIKD
jgi:hypothetical protein